jgi:DNA-binding beta-propeller fold protein YncE
MALGMRRITNFPIDIALGKEGRMFVLCRSEGAALIRKYNFDDQDLGTLSGYGSDDGKLTWPVAITADADENLYVTDEYLNRVTILNSDGEFVAKWGESGSGEGQLDRPAGIAFDPDGNLVVVDSMNHRVQKFTKDGKYLTSWGSFGTGDGEFNMPWGVTVDELGDVYVADWRNDRIQKFNADGRFAMSIGRSGSDDGEFNRPTDVAVDADGDIYVADWGNDRVQQFNAEGQYIYKFLGDATLSKVARDYMMTNAAPNRLREMAKLERQKYLRKPMGVVADSEGRLLIADNGSYRLQVYTKDAIPLTPTEMSAPLRSPTLNQE